jgi:hypothetical protein
VNKYAEAAQRLIEDQRVVALYPSYQIQRAGVYALLALGDALTSQDVPERHPVVEAEVLEWADGRRVGDIIDALGYDGFPVQVAGPSIFALAGEGLIRIDEDQRVHRA